MNKRRLLILLFVAVAAVVLLAIPYYQRVFSPNVTTPDGKPVDFFVRTGSDYIQVGDDLLKQKLLKSPKAFHWLAEQMNYTRNVKPGRYVLTNGMSTRDLVTLLRSGKQTPVRFTFVKFRTLDQLAEYAATKLEFSEKELLTLLRDPVYLRENGLSEVSAISIFIPNTYEFYWNTSAKGFMERMLKEYKTFWSPERTARRERLNLTRLEVMTIASIVEEETNYNPEKPRIAGVYLNRIRQKMPLQADPTVKFAVGDFTLRRVLFEHTSFPSPYNTYLNPGIPPGPICTPSIPSIDAVLSAEKHNFLYFCAKADGLGQHAFATNLSDHEANARAYQAELDRRGIR